MKKYDRFVTNWMVALHITIVALFSAAFIVIFHLNNVLFIYVFITIYILIWTYNILKIKKLMLELLKEREHWKIAATYDTLTGILNRGIFIQKLTNEIKRAHRYKEPLSFAIFDLDFFKNVNDTYGHTIGDEVLVTVSDNTKRIIRNIDSCGRLGGEEFGLMFPETNITQAKIICERIRTSIEEMVIDENIKVTISIGLTYLKKDDDIDSIYERADKALYMSKDTGRNKTSIL